MFGFSRCAMAVLFVAVARPALASADLSACANVAALEDRARSGRLEAGEVECLEARYQDEDELDRFRISQLLIADAGGKGDDGLWGARVSRHLTEVDPTDALLALEYGEHILRQPEQAELALSWAEVALEHSYRFDHAEATQSVIDAHRLRTRAGRARWEMAQAALVVEPEAKQRMQAAAAQSRMRLYAVDWMKQVASAGQPTTEARAYCVETGWTEARCDEAAAR
ncbi:MAG: hypothetical protein JRI25_08085 [Deltaproteobacteria bacterium]|nr:hypothetical protein [Deltaproteobacteria bacterium]MBW2254543.1 hypothetical protein [Deltaproteobacteria bacterium]